MTAERLATRRAAALLAALAAAMTGCAWESARGPGSDADPAEVDRMLASLVGPTLDDPDLAEDPPASIRDGVAALAHEHPRHVGAQWAAAVFAYRRAEPEAARVHLDRILAREPGHVGAAVMTTRLAVDAGSLVRARRTLDAALAAHPEAPLLHETSAWLAWLGGEPERALDSLDRAFDLGAPEWRVAFNRGQILEKRGELEAARAAYDRCLELRPEYAPAAGRRAALATR